MPDNTITQLRKLDKCIEGINKKKEKLIKTTLIHKYLDLVRELEKNNIQLPQRTKIKKSRAPYTNRKDSIIDFISSNYGPLNTIVAELSSGNISRHVAKLYSWDINNTQKSVIKVLQTSGFMCIRKGIWQNKEVIIGHKEDE